MIYGIEACIVPPSAYTPSGAVHFDGATSLSLASLASTNNSYFSVAGNFKVDWSVGSSPTAFIIDPSNQYAPFLQANGSNLGFGVSNNGSGGWKNYGGGAAFASTAWQHIMGSIDVASGHAGKLYFDDVDTGASFTGDSSFTISSNGLQLYIGDDSFGDFLTGDICDLSIWPGVSFLTTGDILTATRRLFRDGAGRPVDPSVAIAALGTPAVMLTGGAATFASNSLGSAGAFTVSTGSLTDAATVP